MKIAFGIQEIIIIIVWGHRVCLCFIVLHFLLAALYQASQSSHWLLESQDLTCQLPKNTKETIIVQHARTGECLPAYFDGYTD